MTVSIIKENFQKEVISSPIPVVIEFYANWCMPCRIMEKVMVGVQDAFKEIESVKFVSLEMDVVNEPFCKEFQVDSIPALVIYNKGKEIGRKIGVDTREKTILFLKEILNGEKLKSS
jgi:thioredoxin 1